MTGCVLKDSIRQCAGGGKCPLEVVHSSSQVEMLGATVPSMLVILYLLQNKIHAACVIIDVQVYAPRRALAT